MSLLSMEPLVCTGVFSVSAIQLLVGFSGVESLRGVDRTGCDDEALRPTDLLGERCEVALVVVLDVAVAADVSFSTKQFAGLTKTPYFGAQVKYRCPCTLPSLRPSSSVNSTPTHLPSLNRVLPKYLTDPHVCSPCKNTLSPTEILLSAPRVIEGPELDETFRLLRRAAAASVLLSLLATSIDERPITLFFFGDPAARLFIGQ
mmetsp:Transcript_16834/g.25310  ORF Transcript_16834/g.25310 Transcript_16834/m.25310 type:complete len:203 (-) Transcript_16834:171-779(-)